MFGLGECDRMADAQQSLARWADPFVGELIWDERDQAWIGRVEFAGRTVSLSVDIGIGLGELRYPRERAAGRLRLAATISGKFSWPRQVPRKMIPPARRAH